LIENIVTNSDVNPSYNFSPLSARYVRIYITANNQGGGQPSIYEFEIYAPAYNTSPGTLESQSFDSYTTIGKVANWQSLEWDETLPSGSTDITLEVATSNDNSTWSGWQLSSSTSPIDLTSLPETRYIKWKATLTTTDTSQTPVLHEVRVKYYPGAAAEYVVLNEILPNPEGGGEWVEIYNKEGGPAVDLAGWYVKDKDGNTQTIAEANTNTGSTVIGTCGSGDEWLVVYLDEEMLDDDGDTVYLYDIFDDLIDSYSYEGDAPVGKSYARIPDGIGDWVDPVPTPGGVNKLGELNLVESEEKEIDPEIDPVEPEPSEPEPEPVGEKPEPPSEEPEEDTPEEPKETSEEVEEEESPEEPEGTEPPADEAEDEEPADPLETTIPPEEESAEDPEEGAVDDDTGPDSESDSESDE